MNKIPDYPFVLIEWYDSKGASPSWEEPGDLNEESVICRSAGLLLIDGDKSKVICPHWVFAKENDDFHSQVSGTMTIPTCSVKKIHKLKIPK